MRTLAAMAALMSCLTPVQAIEKEGSFILNDLAFAKAEARKTGKPLFVVFRCER